LLREPSILKSFLDSGSHFIGSHNHWAYSRLRKFLVALESTRATVSACLCAECMNIQTVIDFCRDIYTSLLLCLIRANLIRLRENPLLLLLVLASAFPCPWWLEH
jgi:hypothetical protein